MVADLQIEAEEANGGVLLTVVDIGGRAAAERG